MVLYYQTEFDYKPISSLEDTTEIAIFWLYKPSMWPLHSTQWTNFSAWHFGLWCCITISDLATKCSVFREYCLDKHSLTFWTFAVTLTLNTVNPIFPQDTLAYDAVPSNQVWLQTDQQFIRYSKNSHKPLLWPWHWRRCAKFSAWHIALW